MPAPLDASQKLGEEQVEAPLRRVVGKPVPGSYG